MGCSPQRNVLHGLYVDACNRSPGGAKLLCDKFCCLLPGSHCFLSAMAAAAAIIPELQALALQFGPGLIIFTIFPGLLLIVALAWNFASSGNNRPQCCVAMRYWHLLAW